MPNADSNAALNRLLVILYRSFPMYVVDVCPWTHAGDERANQVLAHIVADERMYAQRITDVLMERRALEGFGEFPIAFTDTHDLSLDYLVGELIHYQREDVALIQQCVTLLKSDPEGRALAEEILGNARGHLESLLDLQKQPAAVS